MIVGATALIAACGVEPDVESVPNVSVVGDTTFLELPIGRPANNGVISVTFEGVMEDSRCPAGVQCVWEGNASIRLTLASDGDSRLSILNSALQPQRVSFLGYTIGYSSLHPYPESTDRVDPSEYVARISIVDTQ